MEVLRGRIGFMTEDELVARVEAMRDEPDAWGSPVQEPRPKRKSERRQRGALVSVRFSPEELEAVQQEAARNGATVSGYLRGLALEASQHEVVTPAWMCAAVTNLPGTDERSLLRWIPDPSPWFQGFGLVEVGQSQDRR
jgi:hypothetical protein